MDKKVKKESNKSDFFIKKNDDKKGFEKKEKPARKDPRLSFKFNNKKNRIKRSELIAEKEKMKLKHKFNKMMRKENKNQDNANKSTKNVYKEVEGTERPKSSQRAESKPITANKRAQLEYEKKLKEKEKEREVGQIFGFIIK